jgi:hypothetical protein
MNRNNRFCSLVIIWIATLCCSTLIMANHDYTSPEKILSFHSDIQINDDASMFVTETITVLCQGISIKHGIYRDFPTSYLDDSNQEYQVGFKVLKILRDDRPEPYFIVDLARDKQIYIGQKDIYLEPGVYTYAITYWTDRQLGFFNDHDELYWNVTGNGWEFVIDHASATVTLPTEAANHILSYTAFTGHYGESGRDFQVDLNSKKQVVFSTIRKFELSEGLTILVTWAKGFITQPNLQ